MAFTEQALSLLFLYIKMGLIGGSDVVLVGGVGCWGAFKTHFSDHDLQNCQILISLGMLWAGKNTKNHQDTEEKCSLVLCML